MSSFCGPLVLLVLFVEAQVLMCGTGDPQSSVYEDQRRWTDTALQAHVVAVLKKQHPDLAHKITVCVHPHFTKAAFLTLGIVPSFVGAD